MPPEVFFIRLFSGSDRLYLEESSLESDLLQLCDQDDVERLLEGLRSTVDQYNQRYTQHMEEMDVYFEDIGLRTGRQLAVLGRMLGDLVAIWRNNFHQCERRETERDSEMSDIRHDHDVTNQDAEATVGLKVNELRQANDPESIERYERSIERHLGEMVQAYHRFTSQQISTLKSFGNVMEKEMEARVFSLIISSLTLVGYSLVVYDYSNTQKEHVAIFVFFFYLFRVFRVST